MEKLSLSPMLSNARVGKKKPECKKEDVWNLCAVWN